MQGIKSLSLSLPRLLGAQLKLLSWVILRVRHFRCQNNALCLTYLQHEHVD